MRANCIILSESIMCFVITIVWKLNLDEMLRMHAMNEFCLSARSSIPSVCAPFCFEEVWDHANHTFWTPLPTGDSGVISCGVSGNSNSSGGGDGKLAR